MHLRRRLLIRLLTGFATPASLDAARAGEEVRCGPFAQGDPPEPTPRTDRHTLDRLVRINQAGKNIPYAVLFLGDSLTEGWDPDVWEQNLDPRWVLNATRLAAFHCAQLRASHVEPRPLIGPPARCPAVDQ
jgi:hypothetical protein